MTTKEQRRQFRAECKKLPNDPDKVRFSYFSELAGQILELLKFDSCHQKYKKYSDQSIQQELFPGQQSIQEVRFNWAKVRRATHRLKRLGLIENPSESKAGLIYWQLTDPGYILVLKKHANQ